MPKSLIGFALCLMLGVVSAAVAQDEPTQAVSILETDTLFAAEEKPQSELADLARRLKALEEGEKKQKEAEKLKKETDAKKPTVKWTGQFQSDFYWFDQDDANKAQVGDIENGEAFRRARLGMFGDYGPTSYRIEVDFALSGRPSFLDVWGGVKDVPVLGTVRAGHFFEPFSLERFTPNRYMTFMERSLADQPFAPARNMGLMAQNTFNEEHGTWALGLFRSDSDVLGDDQGDPFESAVTGRVTSLLWYDEECDKTTFMHVGLGYSFRDTNGDVARFRSQPESRVGSTLPNVPFFVDTGNIRAHNFQLVGLESAWVNGPFSLQGEYMLTPVNAIGRETLFFTGWYAQASYFLTGEHRPYRKDNGTFDRVIPRCDAVKYGAEHCLETGPGAVELALRLSHLDLDDDFVRGGNLTDFTVGLNWYLNPYLRVTANYIRSHLDDDPIGKSSANIYAMRVGYEF